MDKVINIARDFSPFAAGRYRTDGPWSGEKFLQEVLLPALGSFDKVSVNLDGTLGLGSSFLEEAFGGLVRSGYRLNVLRERLIVSGRKRMYVDRAWQYIQDEDGKLATVQ
ncbi:STAS-like domain-containing protein [Paracandidimonas lactea]|uniref:STAS-like domain-containing protein n=1 Tax=Paracandidimonas lactea TaxID=2895524 RepID=UPI001F215637|nr:STAS-like domain-containing protein [Paracandidimonas lactea]